MGYTDDEDNRVVKKVIWAVAIGILLIILYAGFISPSLKPWRAQLEGRAELAQAEQNRQIQIVNAEAANVAATSQAETRIKIATADAQAEVERAKGVAQANAIIAEGLKNNEEYLRYLWIQELGDKSVIYVPTEGNLPILEAGRR